MVLTGRMILRLLIRLVVLALIIGAVAALVPGIDVHGGFGALLWIAVLFALVNAVIGPIVRLLSLPFIVLTLGLFLLVVNAGAARADGGAHQPPRHRRFLGRGARRAADRGVQLAGRTGAPAAQPSPRQRQDGLTAASPPAS